jgi:CMP-N-acetylneuraminic acid synthetase
VEYTLRAARDAKLVEEIYLSSDDEEVLEVGREMGCKPVVRPKQYATDTATAADVVNHLIEAEFKAASDDTYIVYLQPTSPFRTAAHIDSAIELMRNSRAKAVVSVVELEKSPFKSFVLNERGELESIFDESLSNENRQSLRKTYMPNGAIYGFRLGEFRARRAFPANGSLPYVMSKQDSIDVDTLDDLELVRRMMERANA